MTRARARTSQTTGFASGRYAVERVLGRGGMATVYRARDGELDRPVAVKVLSDRYSDDDEFVRRFRREALTAARLAHPNIVAVYDAGEEDGRLFIVMECVDGDGLDTVRKRDGRLAPDRVVELGLQACAALAYAHGQGVVHRDVKPANLLLRRDGLLKVSDFGIARAADATQLTQAGTMLGTASYAAPEQARGEQVGPHADLFSLGVVLYELLTGELPWRIDTLASLAAVGTTPARPVRDLAPETSPELEAAVMRCLARDPQYRPATAGELAAELAGDDRERAATVALTGPTAPLAPPAAETVAMRERDRPTAGRTRARGRPQGAHLVALAVALVAVALVVGFLVAGGTSGDEGDPPPAEVEPVPRSDDAAQQARDLAEWLREHTAGADEG